MSTINKKHKEYFLYKEGVYVIVVLSECSIAAFTQNNNNIYPLLI
jgi:hypothetical protein